MGGAANASMVGAMRGGVNGGGQQDPDRPFSPPGAAASPARMRRARSRFMLHVRRSNQADGKRNMT